MFWLPLALAGAGALQGSLAERDQKKHNEAAAESNRYSAWTGKNPMQQRFGGQTALGGAIQGGVGGLSMAQQMGGFNPSSTTTTSPGGFSGKSMFGGDQYASELGGMGKNFGSMSPMDTQGLGTWSDQMSMGANNKPYTSLLKYGG